MGTLPGAAAVVRGTLEVALDGLEVVGSNFDLQLALDGSFRAELDACTGKDGHGAGVAGSAAEALAGNIDSVADGTSSSERTAVVAAVVQHSAADASNDRDFLGTRVL